MLLNNKQKLNTIAKTLNRIGLKQPLYNSTLKRAGDKALEKIDDIIEDTVYKLEKNPKRIIIHSLHGTYLSAIYKETAMAKALQLRGHDVTMLLCDGFLNTCSGLNTYETPANVGMCRNCRNFSKKFLDKMNIPYITYAEILDKEDMLCLRGYDFPKNFNIDFKMKMDGVDVSFHAKTSVQRYLKGKDVSKEEHEELLIERLGNAVVALRVAKHLRKEFDILLTSHSCYAEWGSFADYFRLKGKPVITWYTGYDPNTLIFDLDKADNNYNKWKGNKKELTADERNSLYECMNKREEGIDCDTSTYGFKKHTQNEIAKALSPIKRGKTFGLFPSMPWDVDMTYTNLGFDSLYDWIDFTINVFRNNPEYYLIIKTHPAEKVFQSQETLYDYIKDTPNNVLVLPPDTDISSYNLFPFIDTGIVYNTTTGLEMLLNNIPVIVAGNAHYSNKGFTYDVKTKKEYKDILFKKHKLENIKELELYSYYYFIKSFIPFPFLYYNNLFDHGYTIKSFGELLNNKYMDSICSYILGEKVYQKH